jgi:hypothetical protein
MKKEPFTIEWEPITSDDAETRLFEVFKILLNNENLYEEQPKEDI